MKEKRKCLFAGSRLKKVVKPFFSVIMVIALTMATAGFSSDSTVRAAQTNEDISAEDIVVLATNDVHCGIDDNIGYDGLMLYKKQMLQETPNVALVDAGDSIQGSSLGTLSKGQYLIDIMNQEGYDFAIPGNHEFDYGMSRFLTLADELDCGYYSCNFRSLETGKLVFKPYKIMSFGDRKVAFIGATTPETSIRNYPKFFQDENGNTIYDFCGDATGALLYSQVQSSVDSARAEGADTVILVTHMGESGVMSRYTSDSVVAATDGIDAVIDAHSHEVTNKEVTNKNGKDIPLVQGGTKLENIDRLVIHTDGSIDASLVSKVTDGTTTNEQYTVQEGDSLESIAESQLGSKDKWKEIYDTNSSIIKNPKIIYKNQILNISVPADGKDPSMQALLTAINAEFDTQIAGTVGTTSFDLIANEPGTKDWAVRNGETNLGDLTADAYREVTGADIALVNGGGIRADISKGDITYKSVLTTFPFNNMISSVEATGQQILDALELGSSVYPEKTGMFLQVSGISYTIDASVPSGVLLDSDGSFTGATGARRVSNVMVGDEPIDPAKTYTVASVNFLIRSGGDGYSMFDGCNVVRDSVKNDAELFEEYVSNLPGKEIPSDYADINGQGRITILN